MKLMYRINIRNCNNIANGDIDIIPGKLNIKYGINGTGKSTVAKAIMFSGKEELQTLKSFFTKDAADVSISPGCTKILAFDEEFVKQVVFKDDEVIENSFEVFLKTPNYDLKKVQVDSHLESLHTILEQDEEVAQLQRLITDLNLKFKRSPSGELSKTGAFKSLLSKQNIYNVPAELESYQTFFENSDINIPWIDWRNKGDDYDVGDCCPYCSETIDRPAQDTRKSVFKKTYKKADSQNLKDVLTMLNDLQEYLVPVKYEELISFIKEDTPEDVIVAIMKKLTTELDLIQYRFNAISAFGKSRVAVADISKIEQDIAKMEFPVSIFEYFGGDKIEEIFQRINVRVEHLKQEVSLLKREMGELKGLMQATILASQNDINEFLRTAGIHYEIRLETEDETHSKAVLEQCFSQEKSNVAQIRNHLSWGEKNAFALILFMYFAVMQNPDLIILDDPISSFDSNKKYAIMHRMFKNVGKKDVSFAGRTVLMLTHDFEPIIDFLVIGKIDENNAVATFVWNEARKLKEVVINPDSDVKLIYRECAETAQNSDINIVSRIVFLRKLCELNECQNEWGYAYEILSSLIHGRTAMRKIGNESYIPMDPAELAAGTQLITTFIPEFNHDILLRDTYSVDTVKALYEVEHNAYLKIQLFREITELATAKAVKLQPMDEAWFKYIDETYHIENDYLHYLDILKFNIVPDYILEMVDSMMKKLKS